ncbi:MAG: c-type cytochrome [Sterolibacterium sp.]|jgi:cytochrome c553
MNRFLPVLAAALSTTVWAAAPAPAVKADPAKGQQIVATVCVACHTADGNSVIPINPKLAGQHPEYLFKQMKNFKGEGGKPPERANPIMNAMIAAYTDDQMRDVAAFLSEQKLKPEVSKNPETIEYGRKLYRAGDQAKGLPACAACHGPTGAGMPAQFPRIAGQFTDYTELQLKSFRAGERANDSNKMMRMVAIKMTDAEIKAVADYVAGLR